MYDKKCIHYKWIVIRIEIKNKTKYKNKLKIKK